MIHLLGLKTYFWIKKGHSDGYTAKFIPQIADGKKENIIHLYAELFVNTVLCL